MNWPRVNRNRPCEICGKPSWCTYNERGSGCMRVESPVQMRNGGWWHPNNSAIGERRRKTTILSPVTGIDPTPICQRLLEDWGQSQNGQLEPFAATLGVSQNALRSLGCVWASEHRAFAFPMVDAQRRVIGIRLRNERSEKWAVKGSKSGLFMNLIHEGGLSAPAVQHPLSHPYEATSKLAGVGQSLLIVEGPTDTAAAIDLGFRVIGRPSCLGCEEMIVQVAKSQPLVDLFILADADAAGQRGAVKLQERLRKAKIVTLPCKDLRQFVQLGGTKELLNGILLSSV